MVRSAVVPSNQGTRKPSSFLQKLTPHDDVEAYLTTFEWKAEREAWPQDQWAGILAPFLTGEPQRAYCDLPAAVAKDYTVLKGEILARLGVTPAVRAHRVHDWTFHPGRSPRSQMHDLLQLATKWLQPGQLTGTQIVERVAMDRYLRALPEALQRWVSLGDPNTLTQFVELVERYQVTEELQRPLRPRGAASQRRPSAIIPWRERQPIPEASVFARAMAAALLTDVDLAETPT
ncbi:zinc finger and SCAN domain-containing protein 21-like [Mantella aurantiaca]